MERTFSQKALDVLKAYCKERYGGSVNAMVEDLGIEVGNGVVHRWFRGVASPQLKVIGPFLDKIGVELVIPGVIGGQAGFDARPNEDLRKELEDARLEIARLKEINHHLTGERDAFRGLVYNVVARTDASDAHGGNDSIKKNEELKGEYPSE